MKGSIGTKTHFVKLNSNQKRQEAKGLRKRKPKLIRGIFR